MAESPPCPLCGETGTERYADIRQGRYHRCRGCDLVWLDPGQRPDAIAERAFYATHENNPVDPGYRSFLDRLATPLARVLAPGSVGLDYGCGPAPVLAAMLRERGFTVNLYDPFFFPDNATLRQRYDFVACSETAEHFHAPGREFARLDTLVRPGGWLGLMTALRPPREQFAGWHYVRDPTHVCFYSENTLHWLAQHLGWSCCRVGRDVTLFGKPRPVPAAKPVVGKRGGREW